MHSEYSGLLHVCVVRAGHLLTSTQAAEAAGACMLPAPVPAGMQAGDRQVGGCAQGPHQPLQCQLRLLASQHCGHMVL